MANPLKKTMVYLGLAEDELEYSDDAAETKHAPSHASSRQVAAPQSHEQEQPRKSATVTPIHRKAAHSMNTIASDMNEILTVHPKAYKDAQVIAENFREGIPVIINLSQMSDEDARRLIDFASGLSQGLQGKIERVTGKVFLLSPQHIAVSADTDRSTEGVDQSMFG